MTLFAMLLPGPSVDGALCMHVIVGPVPTARTAQATTDCPTDTTTSLSRSHGRSD